MASSGFLRDPYHWSAAATSESCRSLEKDRKAMFEYIVPNSSSNVSYVKMYFPPRNMT